MIRYQQGRAKRRAVEEAPRHIFGIGQLVRMSHNAPIVTNTGASDVSAITAPLPPIGGSPQYRIRNEDERYERVTTQDNLVAASNPAKGGSDGLMERTFGHG